MKKAKKPAHRKIVHAPRTRSRIVPPFPVAEPVPPEDPPPQFNAWVFVAVGEQPGNDTGIPKHEWYQIADGTSEACHMAIRDAFNDGWAFVQDGQDFLGRVAVAYVKPQ